VAPLPAAAAAARALGRLGLVRAGSSRHRTGCAWFTCLTCLTGSMSGCLIGLAVTGALIAVVGANSPPRAMAHSCATSNAPCALTLGAGVVAPIRCGGLHASQGYGETPWEHPHTGIDVVCPAGTVVVAVTSGVFHRRAGSGGCAYPAGASGGLGTYGELDAADVEYLYGHLEAFAASDGAFVSGGTPLGFEGSTGCSSGYHLHFEVRVGGALQDPCRFLPPGYPAAHDASGERCWGLAPP